MHLIYSGKFARSTIFMVGDYRQSYAVLQGISLFPHDHGYILTVSQVACDPSLAGILARQAVLLFRSCQAILDLAHVVSRVTIVNEATANTMCRFTPCIFLMEASVIFIPCWHIVKNRQLKTETLNIIAEWERKQSSSPSVGSDSTRVTRRSLASQIDSFKSSSSSRRGEMYTMTALEKALETNPTPLLLFSAFKDFSGENIQFLSHIQQWKANWNPVSKYGLFRKNAAPELTGDALRRQQFNKAVQIYSSFISLRYSDYPVNLSSGHYKELEAMFDGTAALCNAHLPADSVTPFNSYWSSYSSDDLESAHGNISVVSTVLNKSTDTFPTPVNCGNMSNPANIKLSSLGIQVPSFVEVPDHFGPRIFENAEDSIKYMVLTNTWPKFVAAGYASTLEKKDMIGSFKQTVSSWVDRRGNRWTSKSAAR